jgi:hypothetical protein
MDGSGLKWIKPMNKKHTHDLSVRGTDGQVVSLSKLINQGILDDKSPGSVKILVGDIPIRNNAKDKVMEISPEDRKHQALYFIKQFPKMHPPYLVKWLKMVYETKEDTFIQGIIDNAKYNKEAQQLIGLIQLVLGGLRRAVKMKLGVRFYIIEPETHLHPKRERVVMHMLHKIYKDETGEGLIE